MWNDGGRIRYAPFVVPLQRRSHSSPFRPNRRGLSAAGIPSMHEPSGLDRGDGKRPDGITVYPYSRDRCLIWEARCFNTFASSSLIRAALAPGYVADVADVRKIAKYAELGRSFIFQPAAVETFGAMGKSSSNFMHILVADWPCDIRINTRAIFCTRECLWIFSEGTPSLFRSHTMIRC